MISADSAADVIETAVVEHKCISRWESTRCRILRLLPHGLSVNAGFLPDTIKERVLTEILRVFYLRCGKGIRQANG